MHMRRTTRRSTIARLCAGVLCGLFSSTAADDLHAVHFRMHPPQELTRSCVYEVTDTLVDIGIAQSKTLLGGRVFENALDAYAFAEKSFVVVHEHCDAADGSMWFSTVSAHGDASQRCIHLLRLQHAKNAPSHQLMNFVGEPSTAFEHMKSNLTVKLVFTPAEVKVRRTTQVQLLHANLLQLRPSPVYPPPDWSRPPPSAPPRSSCVSDLKNKGDSIHTPNLMAERCVAYRPCVSWWPPLAWGANIPDCWGDVY